MTKKGEGGQEKKRGVKGGSRGRGDMTGGVKCRSSSCQTELHHRRGRKNSIQVFKGGVALKRKNGKGKKVLRRNDTISKSILA